MEVPDQSGVLCISCYPCELFSLDTRDECTYRMEEAISGIIHVMHILISVACRFILRLRRIVAMRSGRPRCEGHILRTSQAMRVALFACTAASDEVPFAVRVLSFLD